MLETATMLRGALISASQEELLDAIPGWDDVQQAGKAIDDTPSQPGTHTDDTPSQLRWTRDGGDSDEILGNPIDFAPCLPSKPIDAPGPSQPLWTTDGGGSDDFFGSQSSSQLQVQRGVFDVTGSTMSEPSQEAVEWLSPEEAEEIIDGLSRPPLPIATAGGYQEEEEGAARGGALRQQGGDLTCYAEGFESDRSQSPRRSSRRRVSWTLEVHGCVSLGEGEEDTRGIRTALLGGLARRKASQGGTEARAEVEAEAGPAVGVQTSAPLRPISAGDANSHREAGGRVQGDLGSLHERPFSTNGVGDEDQPPQQQQASFVYYNEHSDWRAFPLVLVSTTEEQQQLADTEDDEDLAPSQASLLPLSDGVDPQQRAPLLNVYPISSRENFPQDSRPGTAGEEEAQGKSPRGCSLKRKWEGLGQEEMGEAGVGATAAAEAGTGVGDGVMAWVPRFLNLRQPPPAVQEKLDRLRNQKNGGRPDQQNVAGREGCLAGDDGSRCSGPPLVPETVLDAIRVRTHLRTKNRLYL